MKRMLIATMIALYAAACGGGTTDEGHHDEAHHEETQGGEHAEHHEEHHGEHHEGMPEGHSDEGDEEHGALPAPLRTLLSFFTAFEVANFRWLFLYIFLWSSSGQFGMLFQAYWMQDIIG